MCGDVDVYWIIVGLYGMLMCILHAEAGEKKKWRKEKGNKREVTPPSSPFSLDNMERETTLGRGGGGGGGEREDGRAGWGKGCKKRRKYRGNNQRKM